ncbi:DUF2017 family protein [Galactobacter caseinivorans]|uniref:DUF2017 family protein n=1 Tax=Galactobacter caseinivorans TaxID=2676123 RepID=A0A496PMW2_9MICC|nr:DUF2017 family protein [Galactobacter caseinivorans]RKW71880.1 DUF2017 family protein [Galactobacter caseinivorans]
MARGFKRQGAEYVATLDKAEARLVANLAADVLEMLDSRVQEQELPDDASVGLAGHAGSAHAEIDTGAAAPADEDAADSSAAEPAGEDRWWEALGLSNADLMPGASGGERRRARPEDPALARLLPDLIAASDATEGEAERLRALTEPVVVEGKREALAEAVRLLTAHPLKVPADSAPRFASALNDIRLVLAERLGIETAEDAERIHGAEDSEDEMDRYLALLYGFVSWLQESLMTALLKRR